jgi:hypothetical protein
MEIIEDLSTRTRLVQEYLNAKRFADSAVKRSEELKKVLKETVANCGVVDDRGNLWLSAGDNQLKHERRTSHVLDTSAVEEWAKANGHWEDICEVVTTETVSEEKLHALGWQHPELSDLLSSFYKERTTWAFKVVEQKSYDEE